MALWDDMSLTATEDARWWEVMNRSIASILGDEDHPDGPFLEDLLWEYID